MKCILKINWVYKTLKTLSVSKIRLTEKMALQPVLIQKPGVIHKLDNMDKCVVYFEKQNINKYRSVPHLNESLL